MSCVCVSCAYKHVCLCVRVSPVIISRMGHPALRGCQQTKYLICFGFCFSVRWSKLCFHSVDKWDSGETIHGVCVCLFERKEERKEGAVTGLICFFVHFHIHVFECVFVATHDSCWRKSLVSPIETHSVTCSSVRAQHLKTVTACQLCSITPSCPSSLLPQCRLSRNNRDSISSVVTPGYSQSVIRDYCMASVLQTSACNLNLTQSHLAFICPGLPRRCCLW